MVSSKVRFVLALFGFLVVMVAVIGGLFLFFEAQPSAQGNDDSKVTSEVLLCPQSCDDSNACTADSCSASTGYQCSNKAIIPCCGDSVCSFPETCNSCSQDCVEDACVGTDEIILTCDDPCPLSPEVLSTYKSMVDRDVMDLVQRLDVETNTFQTRQGSVFPVLMDVCLSPVNCVVPFLENHPVIYNYPGVRGENRSVIYILPEGACEKQPSGAYECEDDVNALTSPSKALHEFTHHLFSFQGCMGWTLSEGIAEYVQNYYEERDSGPSAVRIFYERYQNNCEYLPYNWRDYDGSVKEICGYAPTCDVLTGLNDQDGWEDVDCRDFKYRDSSNTFHQNYDGAEDDYSYTLEEFKTSLLWDDSLTGDHNRGSLFFLALEDQYGFTVEKLGDLLKLSEYGDECGVTKQKLSTIVGADINTLWDFYEMDETYEGVAQIING